MAQRTKVSDKDCDVGIYRSPYGYVITWQDGGRQREKSFSEDTPVKTLRDKRAQKVKEAKPAPVKEGIARGTGSFTRDVVRYLRTIKGRPQFKSTRSHLRPWCKRFGAFSRHAIDREKIQLALAAWSDKSPRELKHRVNALRQVFNLLDGGPGPCALAGRGVVGVRLPKVPKTRPQGVADTIIATVAARLQEQERKGRLRDGKTRARFLVLATTGKRPCQMRRARPEDVNLETRVWEVVPAKNSSGGPCYLNDEMFAAWQLFIVANAWGAYNHDSYVATLQRNGWPKGIRPYRLRHQVGRTMQDRGVELGAIQMGMGHGTMDTTRTHYVPGEVQQAQAASEAIEGRFTGTMFTPREYKPTRRKKGVVLAMPTPVGHVAQTGPQTGHSEAPMKSSHGGLP